MKKDRESLQAYYATDKIKELVEKVISVRSLDFEVFDKYVRKLMDECYEAGYNNGREDLLEDEYLS